MVYHVSRLYYYQQQLNNLHLKIFSLEHSKVVSRAMECSEAVTVLACKMSAVGFIISRFLLSNVITKKWNWTLTIILGNFQSFQNNIFFKELLNNFPKFMSQRKKFWGKMVEWLKPFSFIFPKKMLIDVIWNIDLIYLPLSKNWTWVVLPTY